MDTWSQYRRYAYVYASIYQNCNIVFFYEYDKYRYSSKYLTVTGRDVIMNRICTATKLEFSEYSYAKVLWERDPVRICPHCRIAVNVGFFNTHPNMNSEKKNE